LPRKVPPGTPSRTNQYVYPRRKLKPYAVSLAVGLALGILLVVAAFSGSHSVASPGPVWRGHSNFETTCASCHTPRVVDARCERCHDPSGTTRYENAGHVWFAKRDAAAVRKAAILDCVECHTDHRGRSFDISPPDDRECRRCHFSSLSKHPEFALLKAGAQKEEGMQFSHKKHLKRVRDAKLDECASCHEPTSDRRTYRPINFDQHCASCHLKGGSLGPTDAFSAGAAVLPQNADASWARSAPVEHDAQGRVTVTRLVHKDPWVLFNIWKTAREVDPEGKTARSQELERRIADLTAQMAAAQRPPLTAAELEQEERRLSAEAAALSRHPESSSDRVRLERALARARAERELGRAPRATLRPRTRGQIERELKQLNGELASLGGGGRRGETLSAEQKQARMAALTAITAPCTLCHIYDGPWMKPVRIAFPVLSGTNFSHLPHTQQLLCQGCHTGILESKKAEDVNLPNVRSCQSCHRSGQSRADCAECHTYHPSTDPWPPI